MKNLDTSDDVDTLARTVWGEARGCGIVGMQGVANVIMNRVHHPIWWGDSVQSVCKAPYQFSCRNPGEPNRAKLLAVTQSDPQFCEALALAQQAVAGTLPDLTKDADSYYAKSMTAPPNWAARAEFTYGDGWHRYYKTVDEDPTISDPVKQPNTPNIHATFATPDQADLFNDQELTNLKGT